MIDDLSPACLTQALVAQYKTAGRKGRCGIGGQYAVAEDLGVTQGCISFWAGGQKRPPWSAVVMMRRLLKEAREQAARGP